MATTEVLTVGAIFTNADGERIRTQKLAALDVSTDEVGLFYDTRPLDTERER